MNFVDTPYFHVQAIRRRYRDRGLFTFPKPFTYLVAVNFPNAGNVVSGETAFGNLLIDGDSDFIWNRVSWYAQDVPFNPPQSVSAANTEGSTWETGRPAEYELAVTDLRSDRDWHQVPFIDPILFSGWVGVAVAGTPQDDSNREDVTPVAGNDCGVGHFANYLVEPIVIPASSLYKFALRQRATGASVFSTHLFALHGVRLYALN
jgi:hypothetical protein